MEVGGDEVDVEEDVDIEEEVEVGENGGGGGDGSFLRADEPLVTEAG